ncbi:MAG: hypothetical protein GX052_01690 [Syntrophomonadaceae bacterium]|jgi:hypothetical protein|nr:hypothetical protein [Syntrophomonadaceae bacterium]
MKNLSIKELNYINDILSWELLAAKKSFQYASQERQSPHHQVFYDAAAVHQRNYMAVLDYLNQVNSAQGGTH